MTSGGLVAKSPMDEKIARLIEPSVRAMGYELVRVRLMSGGAPTLQIMAERPDGTMDVDACADLSHAVSALLDVEDPISGAYSLEVSSPGIDRPLTRPIDFERWRGHEAKLELRDAVDGRKRYRGVLDGIEGSEVRIRLADGEIARLEFELLGDAKLLMTDALIAAALKRGGRGAVAEGAEVDLTSEDDDDDAVGDLGGAPDDGADLREDDDTSRGAAARGGRSN